MSNQLDKLDYTLPENVLPATPLKGVKVINTEGKDIGHIEEIVLDLNSGRIAYAVLAFGGFMGFGEKLFAIPFRAMLFDHANNHFILNVPKAKLDADEGFDKNHWPDMANREWGQALHHHYGYAPYWENEG